MGALLASRRLTELKFLALFRNRIDSEGLRSIVTAPQFQTLREFWFGRNNLDAGAGEALAAAKLPNLEKLEVTECELSDAAMHAFSKSDILQQLTHLDLSKNPLMAEGMRSLLSGRPFPRLRSLVLNQSHLADEGVKVLADSRHFPNLVNLDLSNCEIHTNGVKSLARAEWANRLRSLSLGGNTLKKTGGEALVAPDRFTGLHRLDLAEVELSDELKAKLTARFGPGVYF